MSQLRSIGFSVTEIDFSFIACECSVIVLYATSSPNRSGVGSIALSQNLKIFKTKMKVKMIPMQKSGDKVGFARPYFNSWLDKDHIRYRY